MAALDTSKLAGSPNASSLYFEYEITGYEISSLEFDYEIQASTDEIASLDISYEVKRATLTQWEPLETPKSPYTQVIGNQFPHWHAARRRAGSTIQRVLNSAAGHHLQMLSREIHRLRANLFVATTDLSELDQVYVVKDPRDPLHQPVRRNLLRNSSFFLGGLSRLGTPHEWTAGLSASTGDVTLSEEGSLFGTYGVRMAAGVGEVVVLYQRRDLVLPADAPISAAVYYAGMAPEETADPAEASLCVTLQYRDGTTRMWRAGLERGTDGEWKRQTLTVTPTQETHSITVAVVVDNRFSLVPLTFEIGAFQLEKGDNLGPWTPSSDDDISYAVVQDRGEISETVNGSALTFSRARRTVVLPAASYEILSRETLPTRLTKAAATTEVGVASSRLGFMVGTDGVRYSTGWRIEDGQVARYNADISQDEVFNLFLIADTYADGLFEETLYSDVEDLGVTQVAEALTVLDGLIYVVVKETYRGRTVRVLKICHPGIRWDDTGHLECLREIKVDTGEGSCTFIGSIDKRPDEFLVTISGVDYKLSLTFDHATLLESGLLAFRSSHQGTVVAI